MIIQLGFGNGLLITSEMVRQARGLKMAGMIQMDTEDFLDLTVDGDRKRIEDEALTLDEYNEFARTGKCIHMPWLYVCMDGKVRDSDTYKVGSILGHEGRHRAVACQRAGVRTIPVALQARFNGVADREFRLNPGKDWSSRKIVATDFPEVFYGEFNEYARAKPNLHSFKSFW